MRHRWLLLLLVVPGWAWAFERGFWLAGLAWLERPSEWSARRWGLKEQGGYGVLRLEVASQDPWREPVRNRIEAEIRDLGLPVAGASLRLGRDGQGEVLFRWERRASAEGRAATPFQGVGGNALRLPPDWQAGPSTAAFRLERVPLERFEYGKQRDRHGVAWRWLPTADTRLELMAERERRQGLKPFGAMVGTTGGNARAAIVPMPIDETTQDMRLALSRGGSEQAWRMETKLSQYRDRVNTLIWQHPFANVPGLPAEAGWPRAIGQAAAPPSNRALMLSASGWRRLRPTLAVHGELMLGRHWQDRPFLPYTAHPDWLARPLVPPPRRSLDGEIRLERAAGRVEWRLSESTELAVLARHERREDRSPIALFRQVPSDAAPQAAAPDARWRFRLPLDWRECALESGLTWRFAHSGRLGLRLGLEETARRFAERDRTRDRFLAAEAMAKGPFDTRLSCRPNTASGGAMPTSASVPSSRPFCRSTWPPCRGASRTRRCCAVLIWPTAIAWCSPGNCSGRSVSAPSSCCAGITSRIPSIARFWGFSPRAGMRSPWSWCALWDQRGASRHSWSGSGRRACRRAIASAAAPTGFPTLPIPAAAGGWNRKTRSTAWVSLRVAERG